MSKGPLTTLAVSLILTALGSIHAFSVFVVPLEEKFGVSRSDVSLTFSLSLMSLTLAVLIGHRIYGKLPAPWLIAGASALAAVGLCVAALANSLPVLWIGYSLGFGAANGLVYGFGMQISAQANPGREGLTMGVVTACYALGAVLAPAPFEALIAMGGPSAAFFGLAGAVAVIGLLSSLLLGKSGAEYVGQSQGASTNVVTARWLALVWLGFFGAVMAGLMVVGHASSIAAELRPGAVAWVAPALLAACNLVGSLIGGRAADMVPARVALTFVPLMSCVVLLILAGFGGPVSVLVCIGGLGFAYGATISAYPPVIAKTVGPEASALVYGRVFTAWGAAGLAGPWLAGAMFDLNGGYGLAMVLASAIALASAAAAWMVFSARQD
ncbi:MAG: MFS transporter [Pseudomonadota bacterium]